MTLSLDFNQRCTFIVKLWISFLKHDLSNILSTFAFLVIAYFHLKLI